MAEQIPLHVSSSIQIPISSLTRHGSNGQLDKLVREESLPILCTVINIDDLLSKKSTKRIKRVRSWQNK